MNDQSNDEDRKSTRSSPRQDGDDRTVPDSKIIGDPDHGVDSHAPTVRHELVDEAAQETVLAGPQKELIDGYRIISQLGEGGMGVVYKAVQRSLNREVALKIMKELGDDDSFVARFRREAITGARLNHPNIVGVFDHGQAHGNVYLALEFVKGRNCAELLEAHGRLDQRAALQITRCAVLGLSHAEKLGVIHRDIKPANIMVVEDDASDARGRGELRAKVADFGLARLHDRSDPEHVDLTQTGSVMGTPGYMAPEQALGRQVDFRADIYSLGSTLYCLLTGKKPFEGATMVEVLHKKINETAPNPQNLVGEIPDEVILVLDRMMAKEADDRYQSYENLLADLDAVLGGSEPQTSSVDPTASSLDVGGATTRKRMVKSAEGPRKAAGPGRQRLMLAGIVVVLLVVIGFLATRGDRPGDGSGGDDATAGTAADLIDEWRALPAAEMLERAPTLRERLVDATRGLEDAVREDHERELRSILAAALADGSNAAMERLEGLWKSRAWTSLAERSTNLIARHREVGIEIPARLESLARFAARGCGPDGAAEKKTVDAILAAAPGDALETLRTFEERFPFSPDVARMRRLLAEREQATGDSIRERMKAVLAELETTTSERFFFDEERRAAIEDLRASLSPDSRTEFDGLLVGLRKRHYTAWASTATAEMNEHWKSGRYAELAALAERALSLASRLAETPPGSWSLLQDAGKAGEGAAGLAERRAWKQIGAETSVVQRVALLEDYLDRYRAFSPEVETCERMLERDRTAAPKLTVRVIPQSARLVVDGQPVAGHSHVAHRAPGEVTVRATADGYFDLEQTLRHDAAKTVVLRLAPKPARMYVLEPGSSRRVPLHVNPRNPSLPPFSGSGVFMEMATDPAGIRIYTDKPQDRWRVASRDVFEGRIAKRIFKDAAAARWQLHGTISLLKGTAELRVLNGADDRSVVVGCEKKGDAATLYLGRRKSSKVDRVFERPILDEGQGHRIRFALTWHGDVCTFALCESVDDSEAKASITSAVAVNWKLADKARLRLAVNRGDATFGELFLHPVK